jgi:hypothetical protein
VYLDEPEQIFVLINSSTYVEEPTLDTDIWRISHNLNVKEVYTQIFDLEKQEFIPSYIKLDEVNKVSTSIKTGQIIIDRYTYLHNNTTSNVWNINHNLGYSGVLVNIYNDENKKIYPKNITLLDENNTIIEFDREISGYAVLVAIGSPIFTDILKLTKFKLSNNLTSLTYESLITEMWNDENFIYFRLDVPKEVLMTINKIEILTDLDEVLFETLCSNIYKSQNFTMTIFYRVSIRKL